MAEDQNQSTPLIRVLDVFGNIFVLNVLFVVFSIPIVTIGASTTAMYTMALKMVRKEEGHMVKGFIDAFKRNFKQATLAWMIELAAFAVLWAEYTLINNFTGTMASFYSVVFAIEAIVVALTLPFLFPLIASFENTLWNTIKNAFLLSISNPWSWIKIVIAWFAPIYLSLNYAIIILSTWYMWLLLFFGLIAYGTSFTINKVFKKIARTQEENLEFAEKKAEKERQEAIKAQEKSEREAEARKRALAKIGSANVEDETEEGTEEEVKEENVAEATEE